MSQRIVLVVRTPVNGRHDTGLTQAFPSNRRRIACLAQQEAQPRGPAQKLREVACQLCVHLALALVGLSNGRMCGAVLRNPRKESSGDGRLAGAAHLEEVDDEQMVVRVAKGRRRRNASSKSIMHHYREGHFARLRKQWAVTQTTW